ncbi:MAG TPA: chemotaxis protein CheD [Candidatus Wallbacteria bacterium]|nr:chemotaxis protein CheD [Candidatus Wallbacteria bacterium]
MAIDQNIISVNMAEMRIAHALAFFRTVLGSCIGVFVYDIKLKIGGLLHLMLPEHPDSDNFNVAKYADSGIPALIEAVCREGANRKNLICKLSGGAKMFSGFSSNSIVDIGSRNQAAVSEKLKELGLRVVASDLGGETGRKILVDLSNGKLTVLHFNVGEKVI